jgi:hypothetical protein
VASGFSSPITNIEYSINAYGNFDFLLEQFPPGFSGVGLTAEGVTVSFGGAIDASSKVVIETIVGAWFCGCGGQDSRILRSCHIRRPENSGHPLSRYGESKQWGIVPLRRVTILAINLGRVKALYR